MGFRYEKIQTKCNVCGRDCWGDLETKTDENGTKTNRIRETECLSCYQARVTKTVLEPREKRIFEAEGRMGRLDTSYLNQEAQ